MDTKSYIFRGRSWSLQEIEMIKEIIKTFRYRIDISRKICEIINWRQANGHLKDAACREVLRRMESKGLINLPPPHPSSYIPNSRRGIRPKESIKHFPACRPNPENRIEVIAKRFS